jgi:hypothetical protein
MDYRTRLIGASLWVQRRPRRGARVACVFGLPPQTPKGRSYG